MSRKLAISLDEEIARFIEQEAEAETSGNVSRFIAEMARERQRRKRARQLLDEYEAKHGEITAKELAEVDRWLSQG